MADSDNAPMIGGQEQREDNSPMLSRRYELEKLYDRIAIAMNLAAQESADNLNELFGSDEVRRMVEAIQAIRDQIDALDSEPSQSPSILRKIRLLDQRMAIRYIIRSIENNQHKYSRVRTGSLRRSIPYTRRK